MENQGRFARVHHKSYQIFRLHGCIGVTRTHNNNSSVNQFYAKKHSVYLCGATRSEQGIEYRSNFASRLAHSQLSRRSENEHCEANLQGDNVYHFH